jgi:hypothetical protein
MHFVVYLTLFNNIKYSLFLTYCILMLQINKNISVPVTGYPFCANGVIR